MPRACACVTICLHESAPQTAGHAAPKLNWENVSTSVSHKPVGHVVGQRRRAVCQLSVLTSLCAPLLR